MSSVVISGDTSGAITLSAPAVSGTNTATLPAATGTVMVSGNMPAFSASAAGTTSIANTTFTKVTLDTEAFDTNNNFASSRFTPTVAGYYQISGQVQIGMSANPCAVDIYKNGTGTGYVVGGNQTGSLNANTGISKLIFLNGTTDYVELYAYQASGITQTTVAGTGTQMSGCLVRTS
jgi:hypothetical protein